ncbi:MAG: response regulator [Thermodesulfobacteriota bacterium]
MPMLPENLQRIRSLLTTGGGLGRLLFFWIALIALVPLALVSKFGYDNARQTLKGYVEKTLRDSSAMQIRQISARLTGRLAQIELHSRLPANVRFLDALETLRAGQGLSAEVFVRSQDWQREVLTGGADLRNRIAGEGWADAVLLDGGGNILFAVRSTDLLGRNINADVDSTFSRACRMALAADRTIISDVVPSAAGGDVLYFVHRIGKVVGEKEVTGLIALAMPLAELSSVIGERTWFGATEQSFFVGPDMLLRSSGRFLQNGLVLRQRMEILPVVRWLEAGDSPAVPTLLEYRNLNKEKTLGFLTPLTDLQSFGLRWGLVQEISAEEAYGPANRLKTEMFAAMLLTALVVVVIAALLADRLATPLRQLVDWTKRVAAGDLSQPVIAEARGEIGELQRSFRGVVSSFRSVAEVCEAIAEGDLDRSVEVRDEENTLGQAVHAMAVALQQVVDQADRIAAGDLSRDIVPHSERDQLRGALAHMTQALRKVIRERETSLREARTLISNLDNLPTPVFTIDRQFRVTYINPAAAATTRLSVKECLGATCMALFRTDLCHTRNCPSERVFKSQQLVNGENVIDPEDLDLPVRYSAAPIQDENGEVSGVLVHLTDITQRLRVMEEMQRQEWLRDGQVRLNDVLRGLRPPEEMAQDILQFLVDYLQATAGAIYLADGNTLVRAGGIALPPGSREGEKFHVGEGLVGRAAADLEILQLAEVPEGYFPLVSASGGRAAAALLLVPFHIDRLLKGVIELAALKPFGELQLKFLDQVCEYIAIAIAASQSQVRMRRLLAESERQAQLLLRQQEELTRANSELEEQTKALQASEEELQAQQEELRVINEELEERTRALEENEKSIRQQNRELEEVRKGLEQKTRDLEQANRYKSEFLANMSHELRTPLNSMLLLSKTLADNRDGTLGPRQVEFAATIHAAGASLLELINEILDLSKIEAGKISLHREEVPLADIADSMSRMFAGVAENKGLAFAVRLGESLPATIHTDRMRLEQVLKNFLANAIKFTDRGEVSLVVERADAEAAGAVVLKGEVISFAVHDTGIGIDPDKFELIFQEFRQVDGTTSRRYGGTGLGLSISRRLAGLLGGEICLESRVGAGSVFRLLLPERGDEELQPEEAPPVPAGEQTGAGEKGRRLLLIEDDLMLAKMLQELAEQQGYRAVIAEDGEKGLKHAKQDKPDAIILDIHLPGIDGWHVLEALKEDEGTRHIPVHFISGNQENLEAFKMGAVGFLTKPFTSSDLLQAFKRIEKVIDSQVRNILVVQQSPSRLAEILGLLRDREVHVALAEDGPQAYRLLQSGGYDCMLLDPDIDNGGGIRLLERLEEQLQKMPVLIYSDTELPREKKEQIQQLEKKIIVKEINTPSRLYDEVSLFLHRVTARLPAGRREPAATGSGRLLSGRKILIVDDDMRNVFALTSILEEQGMKVEVAKDGRDCLDVLERVTDIDLVLLDIMLPVMDGYETMRHIRADARLRDLPIIALTAKAMLADKEKCIAAGANDYMAKPVHADRLLSLLKVWLYAQT